MRYTRGVVFDWCRTHPCRRFISDNDQAVTAFAAESMNQTTRIFVRQTAGFAATVTEH
jgi:hypothetical protein